VRAGAEPRVSTCAALTRRRLAPVIGAGIMALPNVFRVLGIIPATVTLLTVYALTHLSLNLLLRCAPYRSAPSTRTHAPRRD
jgi:amino acid permease